LQWSESENIVWKTPIHDAGWSSPVIWGRQIWLTTARPDGRELFAVCLDRATGKILHDVKVFAVAQPEAISGANTYASPTPLIEAGRVFVHFGTYGTACLDTQTGAVLWRRDDIHCDHHVGPGSSLASAGNLLVFHMDGTDEQYVIALDKATGKTVWKTPRSADFTGLHPQIRKAFSTPAVAVVGDHEELVCTGGFAVMGYEARTGRELWKARFVGWSTAVRPVCGQGLAFIGTDCERPQLWAVRLGGQGDVTDTRVVWKLTRHMPETVSPLLADGLLYVITDQGQDSCIAAATGNVVWEQKLPGTYGASPVLVAGGILFCGRNGGTTVVAPGREYKQIAVNTLDGTIMASPAVADNALFIRTKTDLYRIGKR